MSVVVLLMLVIGSTRREPPRSREDRQLRKSNTAMTCPRLGASASLPECRPVKDTAQEETVAAFKTVVLWWP